MNPGGFATIVTRRDPPNQKNLEGNTMPTVRTISRKEWNAMHSDYKGVSTILVCRHCDAWVFASRPDQIPAECTATTDHEWTERKQRTMLGRDERGTFLELVEVAE